MGLGWRRRREHREVVDGEGEKRLKHTGALLSKEDSLRDGTFGKAFKIGRASCRERVSSPV